MDEFLSNIDRCYHQISDKPISKISSSVISLSFNYIKTAAEQDNKPLIIGIPYKGDLSLILSAGLMKNFFIEDYLLHSGEHFSKLQLKNGDGIKIFGMQTAWISSTSNRNGKIKLKQIGPGSYGEQIEHFSIRNIKNEWLPYIKKLGRESTRIINFKTFYDRIKEHRVKRTALDKFLDYNEKGFGIPSQALYSNLILVSGRGRKAKTIQKLKEYQVHGEPFFNILIKTGGLKVLTNLKSYIDCFDNTAKEKFEKFISYAKKIFQSVPEYDSGNLLKHLTDLDIHSSTFLDNLEDFESFIEDNELTVIKNHLNKLKEVFPEKQNEIPENLRGIIIDDPSVLNEYPNTIQGFLKKKIPVIVLTDFNEENINEAILDKSFRFYFSKKKINYLIQNSEEEVYDNNILTKNKNFLYQSFHVELFNDDGFEDLIITISGLFLKLEGFEDLKNDYWKIAYPTLYLFKNSPQSDFSEYRHLLSPFLKSYKKVKEQLPNDINEFIDLLYCWEGKNNKKAKEKGVGFNQIITLNNQTNYFNFKEGLLQSTYSLKGTIQSITFTGVPYKEYYQKNIIKAFSSYCIPHIQLLLYNKEFGRVKAQINQFLFLNYFEDYLPFIGEISHEYLFSKEDINNEVSSFITIDRIQESNDVEIDLVKDDFHQQYISLKRNQYISTKNDDHVIDCLTINFSTEEWMFISKNSRLYIASEENDDVILTLKVLPSQVNRWDLMILYNLDVSQLTFLASKNQPLRSSIVKLGMWRKIIVDALNEKSLLEFYSELESIRTEREKEANPSIQNLRNWCNDKDLIAPMKQNLSLILRYANKHDKLDEIWQAKKDVIAFRNTIRREIRNKLKSRLPKILLGKNPNSDFTIKIFGLDLEIKTREITSVNKKTVKVSYQYTKKLISD